MRVLHSLQSLVLALTSAVLLLASSSAAQQQNLSERDPLTFPPAPTVSPHPLIVKELSASLSGRTVNGVTIEVASPNGIKSATVHALASKDRPRGEDIAAFRTTLELRANSTNHILFTAITPTGTRSSPTATTIIHDEEPPSLFIDFPKPGDVISTNCVDVIGRVGDRLSGFEGLRVAVRGSDGRLVEATVDVGVGPNGTFIAEQIPINPGSITSIRAFAADVLLNQSTTAVEVTQEDPVGAQMVEISGNRQEAMIGTALSERLRVQVLNTNGSIFPGKSVSFSVTRSNGVLREDPNDLEGLITLQVDTDPNGFADAYWTLGSDAGCGNNRVQATSMSIAAPVTFCASATTAPPSQINVGTGNSQVAETSSIAPLPLEVWVSDGCNGVEGVEVTFRVLERNGLVNGSSSTTVFTQRTGHANAQLTLGSTPGNNLIEATFPGNPNSPVIFVAQGRERDPSSPTRLTGVVLDNGQSPIENARCVLHQGEQNLEFMTLADGTFEFPSIPFAGLCHLEVDGTTASRQTRGMTMSFPGLEYEVILIPNAENTLSFPVRLPPLTSPVKLYDGRRNTILTIPGLDGFKMTVRARTKINGETVDPNDPIPLSVNQVHADDIPMPMPDGASPPFAWTIQPAGTEFDPPIEVVYPNVSGLPPGSISYFLSFDHDIGKFGIVGSGMVVEDGSVIVSDPGSGIAKAGWGGICPPYSITEDALSCDSLLGITSSPCTARITMVDDLFPDIFRNRGGKVYSSIMQESPKVSIEATVDPPVEGVTLYWTLTDPDDPSTDNHPIDLNGPEGNDNRGTEPQHGVLDSATSVTDARGIASVLLTASPHGGDNYIVEVRTDPSQNSPSDQSPTITVWMRRTLKVYEMAGADSGAADLNTIAAPAFVEFVTLGTSQIPAKHTREYLEPDSLLGPEDGSDDGATLPCNEEAMNRDLPNDNGNGSTNEDFTPIPEGPRFDPYVRAENMEYFEATARSYAEAIVFNGTPIEQNPPTSADIHLIGARSAHTFFDLILKITKGFTLNERTSFYSVAFVFTSRASRVPGGSTRTSAHEIFSHSFTCCHPGPPAYPARGRPSGHRIPQICLAAAEAPGGFLCDHCIDYLRNLEDRQTCPGGVN